MRETYGIAIFVLFNLTYLYTIIYQFFFWLNNIECQVIHVILFFYVIIVPIRVVDRFFFKKVRKGGTRCVTFTYASYFYGKIIIYLSNGMKLDTEKNCFLLFYYNIS